MDYSLTRKNKKSDTMEQKPLLASALALLLTTPLAQAADLIGHSHQSTPPEFYQVDTTAGTDTLLGELELDQLCPDLELSPSNTFVCVARNADAYTLDASDGSLIRTTTVDYPTVPGDTLNVATALEYVGPTLFAAFDRAGPETDAGWLGTLDPETGDTTLIGELAGMNAPAGGLAYDGSSLYAVSSANSVNSELYRIDTTTGAATRIADVTLDGQPVMAMTALAIVDGAAYTKSNDTVGGTTTDTIYQIDLSTGELAAVATTSASLVSLTSTPTASSAQPIPAASLWSLAAMTGLLALLGIRRRAKGGA